MAKRGISMMAEQQRLRTVRGGLESLSVWDDSETDRRFRRLETGGTGKMKHALCGSSVIKGTDGDSHLWRSDQPGSIPGLESAQAVHAVSSFLAEAALGGGRSPLLLVERQTLHAAVNLQQHRRTVNQIPTFPLRISEPGRFGTLLKRGEQDENCRNSKCSSSLVSSSSSESTWWYRSERADGQTHRASVSQPPAEPARFWALENVLSK